MPTAAPTQIVMVGTAHPTKKVWNLEMTNLVAKIILAILLIPFTGMFTSFATYAYAYAIGDVPLPITCVISLATFIFAVMYWLLLWRGSIQWTSSRVRRTWLVGVLAAAFGTLTAGFIVFVCGVPVGAVAWVVGHATPAVWMLGTVLVWLETPQERIERLKLCGTDAVLCPMCGYNMTGLRETRCPECGAQFTVDELYTAQREREQELEQA